MYYIRTFKTTSSATAVQIVKYENRKRVIIMHIGSARTPEELISLKQIADDWIKKNEIQLQIQLYPAQKKSPSSLIAIDKCKYIGTHYTFIHNVLSNILVLFKFHLLDNELLTDLVIMRLIEPTSKLRSLELLEELFGRKYDRRDWYRSIPALVLKKDSIEAMVVALAKKEFNFNFSVVFYDVTTLYFESFEPDELQKPGFSKDGKSNQPQILIGLIVSNEGFPVSYEIFEGNKFEGQTLIPVILSFKKKHQVTALTVVADAAMISYENIKSLKENNLEYIVGARTGNLTRPVIESLKSTLNEVDGASCRIQTGHGDMVVSFSAKRFRKDKYELEKQIKKAESSLKSPSKITKTKFLKQNNKANLELNNDLIEKAKLLLGIKGYYTNLSEEIDNSTIINHYHNLWHVEQAFRVAKSDLKTRPIYHFKKHTIEAHILLCFMALAVAKYIENKTGKSIKASVKTLKSVTDARILNTITNEEIVMRSEISEDLKEMLEKLDLSH